MTYDKDEIKNNLTIEQVYDYVQSLGGEPTFQNGNLVCATICHNHIGEGSHKLYYYDNTKLFRCFTTCGDYFDIFDLTCRAKEIELNKAIAAVAGFFNIEKTLDFTKIETETWEKVLESYDRIEQLEVTDIGKDIVLKEFDSSILDNMTYPSIAKWRKEGISINVMKHNRIGYYPVDCQITIPHFDKDGRFVGLRGRYLDDEMASLYGKYKPIFINKILYNHPLGFNLYGLDKAKDNIKIFKKAIVFESEKAVLLYQSYFGIENTIAVAVCGSSFSPHHFKLLKDSGAEEIIIAFDRQFKTIGDDEFKRWTKKLKEINNKYKNYCSISFIFDKWYKTNYKDSPIDKGKDLFLFLYSNRIIL